MKILLSDALKYAGRSQGAMEIVVDTLLHVPGSELILGNHDWFPIRVLDQETGEKAEFAFGH